jgi:hypothetical protein
MAVRVIKRNLRKNIREEKTMGDSTGGRVAGKASIAR